MLSKKTEWQEETDVLLMNLILTLTMQSERYKLMTDKKYKVIVSDRAKRMLGTHIRFMAQVNKDAAKANLQV